MPDRTITFNDKLLSFHGASVHSQNNTNEPFFIVGSPRSGTTLLRDLLRKHPNLASPEETHFYRWMDPFGTKSHERVMRTNDMLRQHRKLDGVSKEEFSSIYKKANSRKELQDSYMQTFLKNNNWTNATWFEKTPQNIYGLFSIMADYPDSKIIHVHRNPLNVIASIRAGRMIGPESLRGAINIWLEAVKTAAFAQSTSPNRLMNVSYEELIATPQEVLNKLLSFLEQDPMPIPENPKIHPPEQRFRSTINNSEISQILSQCRAQLESLGYSTEISDYTSLNDNPQETSDTKKGSSTQNKGFAISRNLLRKISKTPVTDLLSSPKSEILPTTSLYLLNALHAINTNIDWSKHQSGPNSYQFNKTIILIRMAKKKEWENIKKHLRRINGKLIYVLDDNIEEMAIDTNLPDYYRDRISVFLSQSFHDIIEHASKLVVTSQTLQDTYSNSKESVTTLDPLWNVPARHLELNNLPKHRNNALRIAWLATRSHLEDLHSIWPQVKEFLEQNPESSLTVYIGKHMPSWLSRNAGIINMKPLPWSAYRSSIASNQYDVAISPTLPTPANAARSFSKYFELTSTGAVPVFSKNVAFAKRLTNDTNCCLVDDNGWLDCLNRLKNDPASQQRLATAANASARKMAQSIQIKQIDFWRDALDLK